jgi:hypothetical protein
MSLTQHECFPEPESHAVPVWRFTNISKLLSLLTTKSIYFTRSDLLGDPHEGAYPVRLQANGEMSSESAQESLKRARKASRSTIFANCWHMNEQESMAMWRLYADREGVAIRSSYKRLRKVLDSLTEENVFLGAVEYIDYDACDNPLFSKNMLASFMHKRKSFLHERELRAVVWKPEFFSTRDEKSDIPPGLVLPVQLDELIEGIYVAPESPDHFKGLVQTVAEKLGCRKPVYRSALDGPALF